MLIAAVVAGVVATNVAIIILYIVTSIGVVRFFRISILVYCITVQ